MNKILRNEARILIDDAYSQRINKFFKNWIAGYCGIDYFTILVYLPDNDMLHFSTHLELSIVYQKNNYGLYDQPTVKKLYHDNIFYPWVTANPTKAQQEIHTIREKIFNMNSGTNFVRRIENNGNVFHVIYCVSSNKKDPLGYFKFALNAERIYQAGDFAYNTFLPILQENCANYILPQIEQNIELSINDTSKTFKNYVLSNEILKNIPNNLNKFNPNNSFADSVINEMKKYYNTYDSAYNNSRSQLKLIK